MLSCCRLSLRQGCWLSDCLSYLPYWNPLLWYWSWYESIAVIFESNTTVVEIVSRCIFKTCYSVVLLILKLYLCNWCEGIVVDVLSCCCCCNSTLGSQRHRWGFLSSCQTFYSWLRETTYISLSSRSLLALLLLKLKKVKII